jgi:hypothetical protein
LIASSTITHIGELSVEAAALEVAEVALLVAGLVVVAMLVVAFVVVEVLVVVFWLARGLAAARAR